jgi:drug/metabolite transporter (DMT)-like permease
MSPVKSADADRVKRSFGASNAAAFVALGPMMAGLMAIPALGEWPFNVVWVANLIIAAGVYLASGGPLPTFRLTDSKV